MPVTIKLEDEHLAIAAKAWDELDGNELGLNATLVFLASLRILIEDALPPRTPAIPTGELPISTRCTCGNHNDPNFVHKYNGAPCRSLVRVDL